MPSRCNSLAALVLLTTLGLCSLGQVRETGLSPAQAQPQAGTHADPLPSWKNGPAKKAVLDFVRATTDKASPKYVPPEQRIATFDNDGTLWVEQPMYTQVMFALDRVKALAPQHPE